MQPVTSLFRKKVGDMSQIIAKRVSNYELFYDLVFVLAIGNLTALLHVEHPSFLHFNVFIVANIMIVNLWVLETVYMNKYGERDPIDIYTIIPSMFIIGNIALLLTVELESTYLLFNLLMFFAYLLMIIQHVLRGRQIGFTRDLRAQILAVGLEMLLAALITLLTYLKIIELNQWTVLLFLPIIFVPLLFIKQYNYDLINFPHMVERSQLITILTFGESVIAILRNYPITKSPLEGALFFIGMSMMFILYISQTYLNINHHQKISATILLYAHLVFVMGLNLFTVGLEMLASHSGDVPFFVYVSGILIFYLSLSTTTIYNDELFRLSKKHYLGYGMLLVLGVVLSYLFKQNQVILALILSVMAFRMVRRDYHIRRQARENLL